mgnify:CR=1 FL=1
MLMDAIRYVLGRQEADMTDPSYQAYTHSLRRILAIIAALFLVWTLCPAALAEESSKNCGSGLTWSLSAGVLSIEGSGTMTNYNEVNLPPWHGSREQITALSIGEGVASIGNLAFYGCSSLTAVTLPDTVTAVGDWAFADCTGLVMLMLGSGLRSIGESAFERCESLGAVKLPEGLEALGNRAFNRCSSLVSVTVPASVKSLGHMVFAYCRSLMQVHMQAQLTDLPEWTFYGDSRLSCVTLPSSMTGVEKYAFYGCSGLQLLYYGGSDENRQRIVEDIQEDMPDFSELNVSMWADTSPNQSAGVYLPKDDGAIQEKWVMETDHATITVTVSHTPAQDGRRAAYDIRMDAVLESAAGWTDVQEQINRYLEKRAVYEKDGAKVSVIALSVDLKGEPVLEGKVLEALAGKAVHAAVRTRQNVIWSVEGDDLEGVKFPEEVKLGAFITKNDSPTKAQQKVIGSVASYVLHFEGSMDFPAAVSLPVDAGAARQYAILYQNTFGRGWLRLQAAVMGAEGRASFYLSALDNQTDYLIAVNVQGQESGDAVIPETLFDEYGGLENQEKPAYVLTGTRSCWGISLQQFTWILAGVLGGCVITVGLVMGLLYRRRCKRGSLPQDGEKEKEK